MPWKIISVDLADVWNGDIAVLLDMKTVLAVVTYPDIQSNMRHSIVFSLAFLPFLIVAQHNKPFPGTYVINGYILQEDTLMMTTRQSLPDSAAWLNVYSFGTDQHIGYQFDIPEGMGICGNGMFYLDEATYRFRKVRNMLVLDLHGGHLVQDKFHYRARYVVERLSEHQYRLILHRIKQKSITPEGQIPDQISATSGLQERTPTGLVPGVY